MSVRDGWSLWSLVRSRNDAAILVRDIWSWYKLSSCWLYLHINCRDDISLCSHPVCTADVQMLLWLCFLPFPPENRCSWMQERPRWLSQLFYSVHQINERNDSRFMTKCHNQTVKVKVLLNKAIISQYFTAPNSTQWSSCSKLESWGKDNRDAGKHALQQQTAQEEIESWAATEATG